MFTGGALDKVVADDQGRLLWGTIDCAGSYALARVMLNGTRQRIVPVRHRGVLRWRVTCAAPGRRTLGEPCS